MSSSEQTNRQILTFQCGDESFAFDISSVREIIGYEGVTKIPLVPQHIRGVLNLRGNVVPVIDLKARLWKEPTETNRFSCILIIEFEHNGDEETLGLLVDSVTEVVSLNRDDFENTPEFGAGIRTEFIEGIAKISGRFVVVLEAKNVLNIDELTGLKEQLESVQNPAPAAQFSDSSS